MNEKICHPIRKSRSKVHMLDKKEEEEKITSSRQVIHIQTTELYPKRFLPNQRLFLIIKKKFEECRR